MGLARGYCKYLHHRASAVVITPFVDISFDFLCDLVRVAEVSVEGNVLSHLALGSSVVEVGGLREAPNIKLIRRRDLS